MGLLAECHPERSPLALLSGEVTRASSLGNRIAGGGHCNSHGDGDRLLALTSISGEASESGSMDSRHGGDTQPNYF